MNYILFFLFLSLWGFQVQAVSETFNKQYEEVEDLLNNNSEHEAQQALGILVSMVQKRIIVSSHSFELSEELEKINQKINYALPIAFSSAEVQDKAHQRMMRDFLRKLSPKFSIFSPSIKNIWFCFLKTRLINYASFIKEEAKEGREEGALFLDIFKMYYKAVWIYSDEQYANNVKQRVLTLISPIDPAIPVSPNPFLLENNDKRRVLYNRLVSTIADVQN